MIPRLFNRTKVGWLARLNMPCRSNLKKEEVWVMKRVVKIEVTNLAEEGFIWSAAQRVALERDLRGLIWRAKWNARAKAWLDFLRIAPGTLVGGVLETQEGEVGCPGKFSDSPALPKDELPIPPEGRWEWKPTGPWKGYWELEIPNDILPFYIRIAGQAPACCLHGYPVAKMIAKLEAEEAEG